MSLVVKFIKQFKEHMDQELAAKTSWGRNEVKAALQRALDKALADLV